MTPVPRDAAARLAIGHVSTPAENNSKRIAKKKAQTVFATSDVIPLLRRTPFASARRPRSSCFDSPPLAHLRRSPNLLERRPRGVQRRKPFTVEHRQAAEPVRR